VNDEAKLQALSAARAIAEDAGRVVLAGFRRGVAIEQKGAIDLVTDLDRASESLIRARMAAAFPHHGLVAEEGDGDAEQRKKDLVWFCDPLDGTTNFAHGHFFFAVSLGLCRGGVPILGVVHAPALRTTWWGGPGVGSFRATEGMAVERCKVRGGRTLSESVLATGFPYDRRTSPENNVREMSRIVVQVRGIRRCGAAAIDLCLVADGTYDGYWEQKLAPWDLAAGAAIAWGAGARLTRYDGRDLSETGLEGRAFGEEAYASRIVATNGLVHEELLREIAAARR
jgi:myo-inositol-1(or 4)-monophosphatase